MCSRADLIDATKGRCVHPMVQEIVDADLGTERSALHRRAARLLAADGAHAGAGALHLLAAEPEADPRATGILAAAGRRALAKGAPDVALRLLRRATLDVVLRLLRRATLADPGIVRSPGQAQFRTGLDPLATLDEPS
jgi:hypothetical protein